MNEQARQLLLKLLRTYGLELARDAQRLNALLKDYAKGQFKREIFLCVQAVREGIVQELEHNSLTPLDNVSARLIQKLQDDCGFDAAASHWTVETWLIALGLTTPLPSLEPKQSTTDTEPENTENDYFSQSRPAADDEPFGLLIDDGLSFLKKIIGWSLPYINNGDGTVTDTRTGLQWTRFVLGQYWTGKTAEGRAIECNFAEALLAIQHFNHNHSINCGYNDWRMPTWDELNSIRIANAKEVIDKKIFPNTPDSRFWTQTENSQPNSHEQRFYTVNFNHYNPYSAFGTALAHDKRYTRLVRL